MHDATDGATPAPSKPSTGRFRFSIDRGGTFTDVYAELPSLTPNGPPRCRVLKLLSEDPAAYPDAPREAIRRVLEEETGIAHPKDKPLDTTRIESIRMGTTVATNALLERRGAPTAFVVTSGFKDLLHIGNQSRAKIFDLEIRRPENVYKTVIEVDERVLVATKKEGGKPLDEVDFEGEVETTKGVTGEKVWILRKPDLVALEKSLREVHASGIESLAVSLAHAYTFPRHEQLVGEVARKVGFKHISLSSELMPMVKLVPRSYTACADAYLTPCIQQYISQFRKGFDENMEKNTKVWFMQSDGGLVPVDKFSGYRAVLSGPAGGVVGYSLVTPLRKKAPNATGNERKNDAGKSAAKSESDTAAASPSPSDTSSPSPTGSLSDLFSLEQDAVIGFDMGGTSTDVSRYSGRFDHVFENQTAGITIQAPQLDINTVAAGGGSRLFFRNGLFIVGPESAGANPGPVCYRHGGPLTITDANLFLRRLLPEHFPRIFGPHQNEGLDVEATTKAFEKLTDEINQYFAQQNEESGGAVKKMRAEDVALGFVRVANEAMCRPIRALTQSKGYDITRHTLSCFGGAGGQHAAAIAANLGIRTIFLHRFSGILSAYGLGLADVVQEVQEPCTKDLSDASIDYIQDRIEALKQRGKQELEKYGFADRGDGKIQCHVYLNLRYAGTDTAIMTTLDAEDEEGEGENEADDANVGNENKDDGDVKMDVDDDEEEKSKGRGGRRKSGRSTAAASKSSSAKKKGAKRGSAASSTTSTTPSFPIVAAYESVFLRRYRREYGFTLDRSIIVDDIRVRAIGRSMGVSRIPIKRNDDPNYDSRPKPMKTVETYFEADTSSQQQALATGATSTSASNGSSTPSSEGRFLSTGVFLLSSLYAGDRIDGPAMIIDQTSTLLIEPDCEAQITKYGDVEVYVGRKKAEQAVKEGRSIEISTATSSPNSSSSPISALSPPPSSAPSPASIPLDNVQLSIFSHRFMSIAEQMGRTLQRTSISTNIKERLDFSCALFGGDGGLVANAPHLPVHLGAMQEAVKFQLKLLGDDWKEGDVIVTNHPQAGGSHLPDITVITPVFSGGKKVFFVASRGHHSDIGGISPGSMPPFSKQLLEEGAAIRSHKLVTKAKGFDTEGITKLLMAPGSIKRAADEPACSGTRNLSDNLSDLHAQVAANQKGIKLMAELIAQYSLPVVQQYMTYIQQNAEEAVRDMLRDISRKRGLKEVDTLKAVDYMDDGSAIHLALTIDRNKGEAKFDFTGTSPEVYSNTNSPPAVTYSAIIYCLRCQVKRDIPLNQGCLNPITIHVPKGCFLNPSENAAVVGGNVLTSQRVTDVVLRAFGACAASQGCMNNLTFGDESFGYYETIAGGCGAGPTWHGQSGVHSHMTNTRITDVEVMERRYPILVRRFALRSGSGGAGAYRGGDGIVRELEFLRPLSVGILSERRTYRPYGMEGGKQGKVGKNFWLKRQQLPASEDATHESTAASTPGKRTSRKSTSSSSSSRTPVQYSYRKLNLGGKNTFKCGAHDIIRIVTPGGGGWGLPPSSASSTSERMEEEMLESVTQHGGASGTKRKHTESDDEYDEEEEDGMQPAKRPYIPPSQPSATVDPSTLRAQGSVAAWQSMQEQA